MAGLSRRSSAESSLKRTKRKAPPPPTSPSAAVQDPVPLEETLQGLSAFTFVLYVITEWDGFVLVSILLLSHWVEKNVLPFV